MPNLIYPRTVSVTRTPVSLTPVGQKGYAGLRAADYAVIFSGLDAGVQRRSNAGKNYPGLPSDTGKTYWEVLIPGLQKGDVKERDVIVDDLGQKYLVVADYWTPLNYQLMTEGLEA